MLERRKERVIDGQEKGRGRDVSGTNDLIFLFAVGYSAAVLVSLSSWFFKRSAIILSLQRNYKKVWTDS